MSGMERGPLKVRSGRVRGAPRPGPRAAQRFCRVATLATGLIAAASGAALAEPTPAVELVEGGPLKILTGYLRVGEHPAVVRGLVRRRPTSRLPTGGHLDVAAFDRQGGLLALKHVRWRGSLVGRHPAAAAYTARLGVPADLIGRIRVNYAPAGAHPIGPEQ
jgi:hypothetical protein